MQLFYKIYNDMTDQEYSLLLEQAEADRSDKDALVDALYSSLQERDNCEYELSQPVPVTKYGKYGTITIHKLFIYHSKKNKKEKYVYMEYVNSSMKWALPSERRSMTVRQIMPSEIAVLVEHLIGEGFLDASVRAGFSKFQKFNILDTVQSFCKEWGL